MLITLGDKRFTVTAKLKHWREFQKAVTKVSQDAEAAEEGSAARAEANDAVMDKGIEYLNEHVTSIHVKGEGDEWVADEAWNGSADDYLEPDEGLALIGKVASPDNPFA